MADISIKPIFTASLQLESNATARVTVTADGSMLFGFYDEDGRARDSRITEDEPRDVSEMLASARSAARRA